ncbi:ATP-binding cassette domain-containing protein [Fusibacter paucivorans]|uniref:ATP-binding cassette domain-containing protein n=1 Tax=Fusibacter paucivorans TaxID=76009 RepID=A0ABS5PR81_9FIRM|nr:ATP-binding cassette domain-containing protein [Fusibacter paucivorans]MBS7527668.1 ATP-binding cassette domain-containing protein [Fusibacter paucivorans]
METFTIEKLTFYYPEQKHKAIDTLSFDIMEGQFVVLCGTSGSGKSTLLRQLKTVLTPHGARCGKICFEGKLLDTIDEREQSQKIGFVFQSPDNQIVTDKVWHELAFGLESLGYDTQTIRGRVAEMASFFGIQTWFHKSVAELSGGQKQLLNLASIMVMHPSVLILDEPTSQLDPIAASDFLATVGKINRELGTTIMMTEHRLEEVFPMADRVMVMDGGRLIADDNPHVVGEKLNTSDHAMFMAMPTPMRIWAAVPNVSSCPITVREGRDWLNEFAMKNTVKLSDWPSFERCDREENAIVLDEVWFKYEREAGDVVKGVSLTVKKGEFLALLGGNGTGKTTTLSIVGGLRKAYRGNVAVNGSVGMLPQNPQTLFVKKTVQEDLQEIFKGKKMSKAVRTEKIEKMIKLCQLETLIDRHPYDLSGGEQQRAALAKVLLLEPEILLLDEPTKGLDAAFKAVFAVIIRTLIARGVTVFMVSHDIEFCAKYAHRCALFFDGAIVTAAVPRKFFAGNSFYTTAANRMARAKLPDAITAEDVILACGGTVKPEPAIDASTPASIVTKEIEASSIEKPLPLWRKVIAGLSALIAVIIFIQAIRIADLTVLVRQGNMAENQLKSAVLLIASLAIFALAIARKSPKPISPIQVSRDQRKLSKRTVAAAVLMLLLIPITLFIGIYYLNGKKYYFIALMILIETMLPFALVFEGRKPQARELVVIASLCAIGVAGRAAFLILPNFSPVIAIVIISAVAFGGETGFLVGAMTMVASNVLAGQGPWTPWQMFAMGMIGFTAGILFRKGVLRRTRGSLCVFGAFCAFVIYGGIMNPASALMWANELNVNIILTYYLTGMPMDLIHAASTVLFLWFGGMPMLEKLDRIKVKYGLIS